MDRCTLFQNEHADVAESAVVGYPHPVKGEGVYAFVTLKMTLKGGDQQILTKELRDLAKKKIAAFAAPDHIQVGLSTIHLCLLN